MEKKTIGSFIAALRKANGMTQKQLAEKLHVSDKAVSRWERDESAPDLSLIPVIAEIFGITSDELLRGERCTSDTPPAPANQEKRLARILNQTRLQFRIRTIVALGCAMVGLIAALLGSQYRNIIGFFLGLICYLGAGISIAFGVLTCTSQLDTEEFAAEQISILKRDILDSGFNTGSILAALTAGTALLLNSSLDLMEVLLLGAPLTAGVVFLCLILKWFLFLPRREDASLHALRAATAGNIGTVVIIAGCISGFFWLALDWSSVLIVGLIFLSLTVPVGLGIYYYKKTHRHS